MAGSRKYRRNRRGQFASKGAGTTITTGRSGGFASASVRATRSNNAASRRRRKALVRRGIKVGVTVGVTAGTAALLSHGTKKITGTRRASVRKARLGRLAQNEARIALRNAGKFGAAGSLAVKGKPQLGRLTAAQANRLATISPARLAAMNTQHILTDVTQGLGTSRRRRR